MKTEIFNYKLEEFNFTKIIQDFLEVEDLSKIAMGTNHETISDGNSLYKNMEQTEHYKKLYEALDSEKGAIFYKTYRKFIQQIIRPQYDEPILFQEKPTHRILFKNGGGISRFHRDSDYGHNKAEINYFLPQTPAFDTNTLWIESEVGKKDFEPIILKPGQVVRFKGVNLMHGAKINQTQKTRVSFDFRVIPLSQKPIEIVDTTTWKEEDKKNFLFKNAHNFILVK